MLVLYNILCKWVKKKIEINILVYSICIIFKYIFVSIYVYVLY